MILGHQPGTRKSAFLGRMARPPLPEDMRAMCSVWYFAALALASAPRFALKSSSWEKSLRFTMRRLVMAGGYLRDCWSTKALPGVYSRGIPATSAGAPAAQAAYLRSQRVDAEAPWVGHIPTHTTS